MIVVNERDKKSYFLTINELVEIRDKLPLVSSNHQLSVVGIPVVAQSKYDSSTEKYEFETKDVLFNKVWITKDGLKDWYWELMPSQNLRIIDEGSTIKERG